MTTITLDRYLQKSLTYLFIAFIIITPLVWTSRTSELFEFPKMLTVYTFTVLILATWILRIITTQTIIFKKTPFDLSLLLFTLSQIISTIFSIDPHTSFFGYYSRFHGGLLSTLAYVTLFYAAVSNLHKADIKKLVLAFVISVTIGSFYALPEHYGKAFSCLSITQNFDTNCWAAHTNPKNRIFGTFGQPNWLAAYLISLIFIPLVLLVKPSEKLRERLRDWRTYAWLSLFLILFITLIFTKSRSGLAGLALGYVLVWKLMWFTHRHRWRLIGWFSSLSTLLLVIFLIFGKTIVPQIDTAFERILSPAAPAPTQAPTPNPIPANTPPLGGTQLEIGGTESGEIRRIVWSGAMQLFKRYPIFGSGVETFAYGYYNVRPSAHNLVSEWDFLYNKAHNEYLNILSTTGIVGFTSFALILLAYTRWTILQLIPSPKPASGHPLARFFSWLKTAIKRLVKKPGAATDSPILIALLAGWWALQVSNFLGFSTVPVALVFYLFPALALGLTGATGITLPTPKKAPSLSNPQYAALTIALVLVIFPLIRIAGMYRADRAYAAGKSFMDQQNLLNAITFLEQAVVIDPEEPVYTDQLSLALAQAATVLHQSDQATQAARIAQEAIRFSNHTIAKNNVHLNYYKTRARVFIHLSILEPQYLMQAQSTLETARRLSPTDPKIVYNLGLLQEQLGNTDAAFDLYRQAIALKPNYQDVRVSLAKEYEARGDLNKAIEQYRYVLTHISPDDTVSIDNINRLINATPSATTP